jgi:hypothetical protein
MERIKMSNRRPEPDVAFDASRFATVQKRWPDGCLCYRATLDDLLSDGMMAPILRSAGYHPDEFREMMTEMARRGETRCSCD